MRRLLLFFLCFLFIGNAGAQEITGAAYDARSDELVVSIAYRGTTPDHTFDVQWGPCREGGAVARLVDEQGMDAAREPFRATARISLAGLPCPRPAAVTLRLGRVSHLTIPIPEPTGAAAGASR